MNEKINVENVSLEANNFQILKNINFSLEDQKIVGLIGRNGAGKTSLLSLLASYLLPTTGQIMIDGEIAFENESKMEQVTFIYPGDYSEETDKVKDFIEIAKKYNPYFDAEYLEELIEKFRLPLEKKLNEMSKGMQSSMNVVLGLAAKTPVTIFDEAYLSMDAPSREMFYEELMDEQQRNPRLFILSTHLVSEAEHLFDEVVVLNRGEVLFHEDYESLVSKGARVTGSFDEVDQVVAPYQQLKEERLGSMKAVSIYGEDLLSLQEETREFDVEIEPITLQVLFNQITEESEYE